MEVLGEILRVRYQIAPFQIEEFVDKNKDKPAEWVKFIKETDSDGDGQMDSDELFTKFLFDDDGAETKFIEENDTDGDGKVSREEFFMVAYQTLAFNEIKNYWTQMFNEYDRDCSGSLEKSEVQFLLVELGVTGERADKAQQIIAGFDTDKVEGLSIAEFLKYLRSDLKEATEEKLGKAVKDYLKANFE